MTRSEIKSLATSLTAIPADADTLPRFIDDVFNEVAFSANPPFLKAALKTLTAGTATYSFETDMLRLIAAFYDDELLSEVDTTDLNAYSTTWAADSGTPTAITQDEITARDYTLYPNPSVSSSAIIPTHGEPYGEDFADNSLVLIYAENRTSSILDIFSIPFALEALAREFSYPSSHADPDFAAVCSNLSSFLGALIGAR